MTEPNGAGSLQKLAEAQAVNPWDVQIRTIEALAEEVVDDYTSRERLRRIAALALSQLMAMTEAAKAHEEALEAEKARGNGLLLPDNRLIIP